MVCWKCLLCDLLLVAWLAWAVFAVWLTNQVFRKIRYLTAFEPDKMSRVLCGSRYDQAFLSKWKIYLGAIFLIPIRTVLVLSLTLIGVIYSNIFCLIFGVSDKTYYRPQSRLYFALHYHFIGFLSRCAHFCMGYYSMPTRVLSLKDYWADYKPVQDVSRPPLIISNHVSYLDMWTLLHIDENPGFLAKASIRNLFIVGHFAKIHHCIFFNRDDPIERERITTMIGERCKLVEEGKMMPLLIFPEGTTTNGRALMKFKKGVFSPMKPFFVYSMKYGDGSTFIPCFNLIHPAYSFFLTMSQPSNHIEYFKFAEPIDPLYILQKHGVSPTADNAWEVVAEETKKLMCFAFGFDNDNTSFQDKKLFDKDMQNLTEEEFRKRGE